jgi:DNA-binding SARP family transcriptional activator
MSPNQRHALNIGLILHQPRQSVHLFESDRQQRDVVHINAAERAIHAKARERLTFPK